jgi:hypothetical protein
MFPEAEVLHIEAPPNRYEADYFVGGSLPVAQGWRPKLLKPWLVVTKESFRSTATGEIALQIDLRAEPLLLKERVAFGVRRALQLDPTLRQKSVRWLALPQKRLHSELSRALDWLWNGIRLLPFSDEDIAQGIGLCFALKRLGYDKEDHSREQLRLVEFCLGRSLRIQSGSWEGSHADGFASAGDLLSAVRPDIGKRLLPKHRTYASQISPLLQLCSNPSRLFVFDKFARLFATQIGPTQVMRRGAQACHFSPARLDGFGLP